MCTAHVQVANISVCLCIDNQSCAKSMVHATTFPYRSQIELWCKVWI